MSMVSCPQGAREPGHGLEQQQLVVESTATEGRVTSSHSKGILALEKP